MFMSSLTILFGSDISRFMFEQLKKLQLLLKFAWRVLGQLLSDLWSLFSLGTLFRMIQWPMYHASAHTKMPVADNPRSVRTA